MNTLTRIVTNSLAALVLGASSWAAQASTVLDFDWSLNSAAQTGSVATLTLTQDGSDVRFDLTNHALAVLGGSPKLTALELSHNGTLTSSQFQALPGQGYSSFTIDPPGTDASYDFYLDLSFAQNDNTGDPLWDGETFSWTLTGTQVADFLTPVSGSGPDAYGIVHIQSVAGGGSVKYVAPVPEPHTYILMMAGLGLMGLLIRRRMNG